MRIFVYKDPDRHQLRAVCSRAFHSMGLFLEQGVGESVQRCKKILSLCQLIQKGQLASWEGENRFFKIFLSSQRVMVVSLSPEQPSLTRISLTRFIKTLQLWERSLAQHLQLPYQVGVGIAVDIKRLESLNSEPYDDLQEMPSARRTAKATMQSAVNHAAYLAAA